MATRSSGSEAKEQFAMKTLGIFWWLFALRGGFAALFGLMLLFAASLFGTIFFDPVLYVYLGFLLGFYVLGNGVLLGVAAGFAFEHRLHVGWLLLGECVFAVLFGGYIGFSLMMTAQSLALLAGLQAIGVGCFQAMFAFKMRASHAYALVFGMTAVVALCAGAGFLLHTSAATKVTSAWLSVFEVCYGLVVLSFARGLHREWRGQRMSVAG
jgi:uncharacterized membrane protein HdeD (DUF308 family)